jgi:hypothetical protein
MDGEAVKRDGSDSYVQDIIIEPSRIETTPQDAPSLRSLQVSQRPLSLVGTKSAVITELLNTQTHLDPPKAGIAYSDGVWRQFRVHWTSVSLTKSFYLIRSLY